MTNPKKRKFDLVENSLEDLGNQSNVVSSSTDTKNKKAKYSDSDYSDVLFFTPPIIPDAPLIKNLIDAGFYVDKTEFACDIFEQKAQANFLVRPRRFGKSLLIDTLATIARGEKKVFAGRRIYVKGELHKQVKPCFIYSTKYDWTQYPVIRLDFGMCSNLKKAKQFKQYLNQELRAIAKSYKLSIKPKKKEYPELFLGRLIDALCAKNEFPTKQVVILIDEYDVPLIHAERAADSSELDNFGVLKAFFSTIKSKIGLDQVKLCFVAGVTRFNLADLGSGANNLRDISMEEKYATLAGYNEEEIEKVFNDRLGAVVQKWKKVYKMKNDSDEEIKNKILQEMRKHYNGYKFYSEGKGADDAKFAVFNPFSVTRFLSNNDGAALGPYWIEAGNTDRLLDEMKRDIVRFQQLDLDDTELPASSDQLKYPVDKGDVQALLFQTGYLTINGRQKVDGNREGYAQAQYHLKVPNEEVKKALKTLMIKLSNETIKEAETQLKSFLIPEFQPRLFFERLYSSFARIPYSIFGPKALESHFQGFLHMFLLGGELTPLGEVPTNQGRMDTVIDTDKLTYIFELKLKKNPTEALDQIERLYLPAYLNQGKSVIVVGVNFFQRHCEACRGSKPCDSCCTQIEKTKSDNHNNVDSFHFRKYDSNHELSEEWQGKFVEGKLEMKVLEIGVEP